MTPKETLIAAKTLIDTPEKWLQRQASAGGRYCAWGALIQVGKELTLNDALELLAAAAPRSSQRSAPNITIWNYNDSHTHPTVMAWFQRAIEAAS